MKKFSMLFLAAAVALVGAIVSPNKAEAVPAFARQVGVACYACHYQHIPKLNSFGREFKLGGYTQSAQDLLQDDGLSIPPVLNSSLILKYRYQMGSTAKEGKAKKETGIDRGEWQLYDEGALLIGGRVGENMGSLVEFGAGVLSSKFVYSKDFGGVRGGLVVFQTDAAGVGHGMELFNTGVLRPQRGFEERSFMANQQEGDPGNGTKYGTATGPAEGLMFFGGSSLFFVELGLWGPATGTVDTGFDLSQYIRLAITPKIGEADLMVGLQMTSGSTKLGKGATKTVAATPATCSSITTAGTAVETDCTIVATTAAAAGTDEIKTGNTMIDAQLQMPLGSMSLEVIAAYNIIKQDTFYNGAKNSDGTAAGDAKNLHIGAELGFGHAGVKAGMGMLDSGQDKNNAATVMVVGGWFAPAQNVDLVLEYATYSGEARARDNRMTLMLEFVF